MTSFHDLVWAGAGLGVAVLFFLRDRRAWPAGISPLFLRWGELPRYLKKVNQEFGFLNTLGLGRQISVYVLNSANGAEKPDSVKTVPAAKENFSGQAWEVEQIVQRALNEKKTLLLIGAPTSGKTTLLQVLAVRSTGRETHRRLGFSQPRIPFYIPAKEINFELPVLAALQQALLQTSCPISPRGLKRAVRSRRAFFLFDGLDEIPAGHERRKACAWIASAQQWCGFDMPFVLTCRATSVLEDVQFNIPYLTVGIRNLALSQVRSLRAVSETRMPPRYFNVAEDNAEYVLITPPSLSTVLLGAKKAAPNYYYYLSRFPVTNRLYRKFVEATKHRAPAFWDDPEFNGDEVPVVGVDWEDAQAYCAWLTEQASGKEQMAKGVIYRLPLEEEWEWAAGGGKRKYPWGDGAPQSTHANFNGAIQGLTPVNTFPAGATPDGLMDMAGNAWEWTATWQDEKKEQRFVRGGAGFNDEVALRCIARDHSIKKLMRFVGFRVARIVSD
jgi:energy-coupling factor transporter ATP-binding protein EcfA2